MKAFNKVVKAGVLAVLMTSFGWAEAATLAAAGTVDFARETSEPTTRYTISAATYTLGVSVNQDWYITYTLSNGVFFTAPTATVSTTSGTATVVSGGAGSNTVTFRINGSSFNNSAADTVTLDAPTVTTNNSFSSANPVSVTAANGLLFIGGSVASPIEAVTGTPNLAIFTQAVTFTMGADGDQINLNPTPSSNSRRVFGPTLDTGETTTQIRRAITLAIGTVQEPTNTAAYDNSRDDLTITVVSGWNNAAIDEMFADFNNNGTLDAGEAFSLATGSVTVPAGQWAAGAFNIILNKTPTAIFEPRTFAFSFAMNMKVAATRPGFIATIVNYANPDNNTWAIVYANGTLLRSNWFVYDPATSVTSVLRLINSGGVSATVVDARVYLDNGTQAALTFADLAPASATQLQLTPVNVAGLQTSPPGNRGYIEVTLAGDFAVVDGTVIATNTGTGTRAINALRNVTFDSGVRGALGF